MVPHHRIPTVATLILLLLLHTPLEAKKPRRSLCPIGFQLAYTKDKESTICYRLKGPEKISDTFVGCTGNLYTAKLYDSLNLTKSEVVLWTDYKSFYPGGPFVDNSYTKSTGSLLESSFEVDNPEKRVNEELCVVIDPASNFTIADCDEEYYRYCMVEPYPNEEDMSREGCEDLTDSWRFWSPKATCLVPVTGVGGGAIRATWTQAEEICERRNGTILYNGWRYSNNPMLHISGSYPVYPLGVTHNPDESRTIVDGKLETRPPSEWGFDPNIIHNGTSYGIVRNGKWDLVNTSFVFYDVVCEKNVELLKVELEVKIDQHDKLIVTSTEDVDRENLLCFTDSITYFPISVKISKSNYENYLYTYVIKPISSGYYWCKLIDSKRYHTTESNKLLWLRGALENDYAIKIHLKKDYSLQTVDKFRHLWERKIKEYIFYSTSFYNETGDATQVQDPNVFEQILTEFRTNHPELNPKETEIFSDMKLKKLFLDGKTVLVHIMDLDPRMRPVQPGSWGGVDVIYMKPVHFCNVEGLKFVDKISVGCNNYRCVGDFNDGVQVLTSYNEMCANIATVPSPRLLVELSDAMPTAVVTTSTPTPQQIREKATVPDSSSEEILDITTAEYTTFTTSTTTTEMTTTVMLTTYVDPVSVVDNDVFRDPSTIEIQLVNKTTRPPPPTPTTTEDPTTTKDPPTTVRPTPPPPREQLEQVMQDLENLLNNDTAVVVVETINETFNQVDELLSENVDLDIPSDLLHLLDEIGNRMYLNGSSNATAIRENIALLVADADPIQPVKGLRIAARDNDTFTSNAFEIIREELNSTHLSADESEAVVQLPSSIASSNRRISFVVFRNDRAFRSDEMYYINSRVLSVNVENLTQFDQGESVDIYFSSLRGDPERNQSRACVYWHFEANGTGYWSQEGCQFIPATTAGMLDICRCDHLTHFAEILVPRTVFAERHETALEIISIIGCVFSMFGLIMIAITAALFRSWRRDFSNKIWLQLCIAILLLITCFLIVTLVKFNTYDIPCMLVGVLLHYSVLASFCWMLVAALLSYRRLVMVFTRDASHKLLRASAFSWGVPCAIVGVLLSVAPHSYGGTFEEMTPTGAFCYPSGLALWLTVYAPIAVMLLANWTLFILIVRSVFASKRIQRHGDTNEALRCASVSCLLVFLFGLPWIFGMFSYNVVAAYFFALTATFQGFVLFIFFVVGNKKTRDLWLNKLKIKQTRKVPVTSSTYTNRSTGPGWRGGAASSSSVEAKASKPRSLASPDDSNFS